LIRRAGVTRGHAPPDQAVPGEAGAGHLAAGSARQLRRPGSRQGARKQISEVLPYKKPCGGAEEVSTMAKLKLTQVRSQIARQSAIAARCGRSGSPDRQHQ